MKSFLLLLLCGSACIADALRVQAAESKPVFLYSRYFNAKGENRYTPEGTFKDVLGKLSENYTVRSHAQPLTAETLRGVRVLLIANPSDKASGNNPPPPHVSPQDIAVLTNYVADGGGLIVMGNQENHNLEINDMNKLLANFGLQFTNLYTDAKKLVIPQETPVFGGLRWAYYTGNLVTIQDGHPAQPRGLVMNDLAQKPLKGNRDQPGALLATAQPVLGRVAVVTDSGWIANFAFNEEGVGGVAIKGQDNWEIFRRLTRWVGHQ